MRNVIGFIVGLYLTAAIVVFGGAAYGFMAAGSATYTSCSSAKWIPWALFRASAWPKTYFDDAGKAGNFNDWLLVQYDPFGGACA